MDRPKLFQVIPTDSYSVYLFYDTGEIKLYDCSWILDRNGVFEKIHELSLFKSLCTIMNGTLAWDISGNRDTSYCIDLCPDTIYSESIKASLDKIA